MTENMIDLRFDLVFQVIHYFNEKHRTRQIYKAPIEKYITKHRVSSLLHKL